MVVFFGCGLCRRYGIVVGASAMSRMNERKSKKGQGRGNDWASAGCLDGPHMPSRRAMCSSMVSKLLAKKTSPLCTRAQFFAWAPCSHENANRTA